MNVTYTTTVAPRPPPFPRVYPYREITAHCSAQIENLIADARRNKGLEKRYRMERAYGVYMGWRTLVMEHTDPLLFSEDDKRLEQMISAATDSGAATGK